MCLVFNGDFSCRMFSMFLQLSTVLMLRTASVHLSQKTNRQQKKVSEFSPFCTANRTQFVTFCIICRSSCLSVCALTFYHGGYVNRTDVGWAVQLTSGGGGEVKGWDSSCSADSGILHNITTKEHRSLAQLGLSSFNEPNIGCQHH